MRHLAFRELVTLVLAAFAVFANATQPSSESVPPGFSLVSASGAPASVASRAYARVREARASVEVFSPAEQEATANRSYRIAGYLVNCGERSVKHESVSTMDASTHLPLSSLSMPKTVWHRPARGSVEAGALEMACKG